MQNIYSLNLEWNKRFQNINYYSEKKESYKLDMHLNKSQNYA